MRNIPGSLVLQFDSEIHDAHALLHVISCDVTDPTRNSSREEEDL